MNHQPKPGPCFESAINVTPLVDVVLVLLIVFMVLLPMMPRGFFGNLPKRGAGGNGADALVLQLLADGSLRLNTKDLSEPELGQRLQALTQAGGRRQLFVDAEDGVSYERLVRVLGVCRHPGGVTSIGFLVAPGKDGRPGPWPGGSRVRPSAAGPSRP
jgi:biopolymer transport protein TolR